MKIEEIKEMTPQVYEAMERLLPQLAPHLPLPTWGDVEKVVANTHSHLFLLEEDSGEVVGTLTLAEYDIPTGRRTSIEDVVVDERSRGKGYGRALVRYALEYAARIGATSVGLTSRASRIEANRLYQSMGFELRETNVYQFRVK